MDFSISPFRREHLLTHDTITVIYWLLRSFWSPLLCQWKIQRGEEFALKYIRQTGLINKLNSPILKQL